MKPFCLLSKWIGWNENEKVNTFLLTEKIGWNKKKQKRCNQNEEEKIKWSEIKMRR